eukprot:5426532-Pleurochrysis_carterae.AAC.1
MASGKLGERHPIPKPSRLVFLDCVWVVSERLKRHKAAVKPLVRVYSRQAVLRELGPAFTRIKRRRKSGRETVRESRARGVGEERVPATLRRVVRGRAVAALVQAGGGREQPRGEGQRQAAEAT